MSNAFDDLSGNAKAFSDVTRAARLFDSPAISAIRDELRRSSRTLEALNLTLTAGRIAELIQPPHVADVTSRGMLELTSAVELTAKSFRELSGMSPASVASLSGSMSSLLETLDLDGYTHLGRSMAELAERLGVGSVGSFTSAVIEAVEQAPSSQGLSDDDLGRERAARVEQALSPVLSLARDPSRHPLVRSQLLQFVLGILITLYLDYRNSAADERRHQVEMMAIEASFDETKRQLDLLRAESLQAVAYVRRDCPAREKPSSKSKKVGTLRAGQNVLVMKESGAWLLVEFADSDSGSRTAWVFAANIDR